MDRFKAITEKTQQVMALAEQLYGVKINPRISFELKGRVAGWAGCKFCPITRKAYDFTLRFNRELILGKHFEDMLNETVAHECAHLICFSRPELGRNHDAGWRRVAQSLGCSGSRCHNYDVVVRGRWDYLTDLGNKVSVTKRHHAYVQAGGTLKFKRGLGMIHKSSPHAPSGQLKLAPKPDKTMVVVTQPKQEVTTLPKVTTPNTPRVTKTVVSTNMGELTWAEKVRRLIREHKSQGVGIDTVIHLAIQDLGMTRERARSCVKAHWDKV